MELIPDTNVNWLKYRWVFVGASLLAILVGVADIARKGGVRYGIDFSEGTIVYAKFQNAPEIDRIRTALENVGLGEAVIQRYDRPELNQVMVRVSREPSATGDLDVAATRIITTLKERYGENPLLGSSTEIVGPVVGAELRRKALYATLLSLAAMLLYIGFRFQFIYGFAATIAVFHDVLITLGLVSIFNYEVTLNVIAAFLTLVGYSVNDTIVIFDRVRENQKNLRQKSLYDLINLSVNQNVRRTILTAGTTFLSVLALYLYGGEVLKGFSFVLVVGILVGTYSTLAIASPVVVWWRQFRDRAPAKDRSKAEAKAARA